MPRGDDAHGENLADDVELFEGEFAFVELPVFGAALNNAIDELADTLFVGILDRADAGFDGVAYHQDSGLLTLGSTERAAEGTYRVTFRFDPSDSNTKETWDFDMETAIFQPVDVPALSSATLLFCPSTPSCASYQEIWLRIGEQLGN